MNTIICTFTSLGTDDKILSYNNLKLNIIRGVQHGKPIRKRHSKVKNEVNMVHIFWLSPLPIFTILPFLISTSVFSKIPSFSLVHTVVFLKSKVSCFGNSV